jgi:hypothetical protein
VKGETHYVPPFTRQNGRKERASCGRYVRAHEVAPRETAPTCADCLAYVEAAPAREADDDATAEALGEEFPEFKNYFLR